MLSLSSANAGSSVASGSALVSWPVEVVVGVVCEARRDVRDGGRKGVVGREGRRVREWEELRWWWCAPEEGGFAGVVDVAIFVVIGDCGREWVGLFICWSMGQSRVFGGSRVLIAYVSSPTFIMVH